MVFNSPPFDFLISLPSLRKTVCSWTFVAQECLQQAELQGSFQYVCVCVDMHAYVIFSPPSPAVASWSKNAPKYVHQQ